MNHNKVYYDIIEKARNSERNKKDQYYESHHIIPKSVGGSNRKENLVLLTPREHFICHLLLVRIYKNDTQRYLSMLRALMLMKAKNDSQGKRYINSRLYEAYKNAAYGENGALTGENSTFYGKKHSLESKEKMRKSKLGSLNPQYNNKPWNAGKTKETDSRIRQYAQKQKEHPYHTNRPEMSDETKRKLSVVAKQNELGKHKTAAHKEKIKDTRKQQLQTEQGKLHMKLMTDKAAEYHRGRKKEQVECPHCKKIGGKPAMKRFHFENCKEAK